MNFSYINKYIVLPHYTNKPVVRKNRYVRNGDSLKTSSVWDRYICSAETEKNLWEYEKRQRNAEWAESNLGGGGGGLPPRSLIKAMKDGVITL